jgi:tetratricopeptide (TPR) repeat protein
MTIEGFEDALMLSRQAISLDPNFSAAYGVALLCYTRQKDRQGWLGENQVAEGKQFAQRVAEIGGDDALSRAAYFFAHVLKEVQPADTIVDQAIVVNPNLADAWRIRGFVSTYLGRHEAAIDQFQGAMRLSPLDPEIYITEHGLAVANFHLCHFDIALSWATKAMARQKNYAAPIRYAMMSYALMGRVADAQLMRDRLRELGADMTLSQLGKFMAFQQPEDIERYFKGFRLAGVPE